MARGIRGIEESPAYAPESLSVITDPEEARDNPLFLGAGLDGMRGALQTSDGGLRNRCHPTPARVLPGAKRMRAGCARLVASDLTGNALDRRLTT